MFTLKNISGDVSYAEDIYNIDLKCFGESSWSYELIFKALENNKAICIVYIQGSKVIGYLSASMVLDELTMERIAVLENYRKNGIGKMLVENLIKLAQNENISVINLEVRSQNTGAIALYTKCGFNFDTIRKKYYQNPLDDAVLMSLKL